MKIKPIRLTATFFAISLVAAACTKTPATNGSQAKPSASPSHEEMMALPPGAENYKIDIVSPADGTVIKDNFFDVNVTVNGFDLASGCDYAGKPYVEGKGHYHVLIDKSLINMYCTPIAKISLQNVKPGKHTIAVVPTIDDHAEVLKSEKSITIDYEPTNPLPEIKDEDKGKPSIKILSPKPGDTVSGLFDVTVQISNFENNCDLFGKPAVLGYGHWHTNLDASTGAMMGMGTMLGMSCTTVFHATTIGLKAGETHTVIALLVDNGHAPLSPPVEDKVEVTIG